MLKSLKQQLAIKEALYIFYFCNSSSSFYQFACTGKCEVICGDIACFYTRVLAFYKPKHRHYWEQLRTAVLAELEEDVRSRYSCLAPTV